MDEKYPLTRNEEEYAKSPWWFKVLYFPIRPLWKWYLVRQFKKMDKEDAESDRRMERMRAMFARQRAELKEKGLDDLD